MMNIFAAILHFFIGVGAVAGGLAAILNPASPLGMPSETLNNSPFTNFLIPGIVLFGLIGVGNLLSGLLTVLKVKFADYLTGLEGLIMIVWIVVQCLVLRGIHFLHITFFIFGVVQGIAAMNLLYNRNKFPFNF